MKTVNIVFVDNIKNILDDQLRTLKTIFEYLKKNSEAWPPNLQYCANNNLIKVEYSDEYVFNFFNHNPIVIHDNEYAKISMDLIEDVSVNAEEKTLFVIDLCLDAKNIDINTGTTLIKTIMELDKKNVGIIACTGVPDYERYDLIDIDNVILSHRAVSSDDKLLNNFPAFTKSRLRDKLEDVPEGFRSFLALFLNNHYKNTQFFGEILIAAVLL